MTATDVMSIMNMKGNDGFLEGNGIIILILFFLIFGFGGNGFGGSKEQYATSADVQRGFDNNSVINKLNGLENGLADVGFALNNSIKDGTFATQNGLSQLGYANQMGFANVTSSVKDCCCETNRNIDSVKKEICDQTYQITTTIANEGRATRDLITAQETARLRDELDQARGVISNNVQTQNILNSLGRYVTNPACPLQCNPCCY